MIKNIIFDTDIGGDCDDVLALDVLMACHKAGECRLIGVAYSADLWEAVGCTYAVLERHGFENVPIGKPKHDNIVKDEPRSYAYKINKLFYRDGYPTFDTVETAVRMYRRLLTEYDNVVIVLTGWFTNLRDLLISEPDDISPLNGYELVKAKVKEIDMVSCNFSHETGYEVLPENVDENGVIHPSPEANVWSDKAAARYVFENCPVTIYNLPAEVGFNMLTGKPMCDAGRADNSPDSLSYQMVGFENGRPSWDPATAYYAVYGTGDLFYETAPGKISMDEEGYTYFTARNGGNHILVYCKADKQTIAEKIDAVSMRLFKK